MSVTSRGGGAAVTVTVTDCEADPPEPVHVNVYIVVCVGLTLCVPETALVPDQPTEVVQEVALAELHESAADWPEVMEDGFAERVAVGWDEGGGDVNLIRKFSADQPSVPVS